MNAESWLNPSPGRCRLWLGIFLVALSAFRLWYIQVLPLSEDEAYYWVWSRHLAWGYFDQGPLVAWLIRLGTWLGGDSAWGVRWPAVLLSLGISLLLYDLCRRLWRNEALGLWLVMAANSSLLLAAGAVIHTYDTAQAFFWLLTLYLLVLALFAGRRWAWYGAGVSLGLAVLAKYSSALLPFLLLGYLLTSRQHRFWLGRKEPWLAVGLALLVFAPNLWWNATHGWQTVLWNLGRAGGEWKFTLFEFLPGQWGLAGPVFFVFLVWGLVLAWRRAREGDESLSFLLWLSLPVLALFTLLSMKTRVQANWPAVGYLAALPAAARALWPRLLQRRRWRRWGVIGLVSGYLLLAVAHFPLPLIRAVSPSPDNDPLARIYGWSGLGRAVAAELAAWPDAERPFIFSQRHQLAALTAFYTPGRPRVAGLFLPGDKPSAYYTITDPALLKGRDGLAVVYGRPALEKLFRRVGPVRTIELKGPAGRVLHRVNLIRCRGFKGRDFRPPRPAGRD